MRISRRIAFVFAYSLCSAVLCGCMPRAEAPSEPNTDLPGFSMWLPKGVTVKHTDYPAAGVHEIKSGSALDLPEYLAKLLPSAAPSTKVSWRVERVSDADIAQVPAFFDAALANLTGGKKGQVTNWARAGGSALIPSVAARSCTRMPAASRG